MKYRDYKEFRKDNYYHIYNRGINKNNIFLQKRDYEIFIKKIKDILGYNRSEGTTPLPLGAFELIVYCLMPNHFHLIIKQCSDLPVSKFMLKLGTSYSRYINSKYSRIGPLFQDTFKAKLIETDDYLIPLSAYIHNNPPDPFTYTFSSLNEYMNHSVNEKLCNTHYILKFFGSADLYQNYLILQKFNQDQKLNFSPELSR